MVVCVCARDFSSFISRFVPLCVPAWESILLMFRATIAYILCLNHQTMDKLKLNGKIISAVQCANKRFHCSNTFGSMLRPLLLHFSPFISIDMQTTDVPNISLIFLSTLSLLICFLLVKWKRQNWNAEIEWPLWFWKIADLMRKRLFLSFCTEMLCWSWVLLSLLPGIFD